MSELSELLSKLHDAATPQEWGADQDGDLVKAHKYDCEMNVELLPLSPEDAALIVALRNHTPEIIAALEAVERVRELHRPFDVNGVAYCDACDRLSPCPTIRALDGAPND